MFVTLVMFCNVISNRYGHYKTLLSGRVISSSFLYWVVMLDDVAILNDIVMYGDVRIPLDDGNLRYYIHHRPISIHNKSTA